MSKCSDVGGYTYMDNFPIYTLIDYIILYANDRCIENIPQWSQSTKSYRYVAVCFAQD